MIFISGPVVVTPSKTITFDAYLPGQGIFNAKWWKIKDQSKKLLEVDDKKYCIYQMKDKIRFEITLADKDDSAAYQLSWKTKKSNRINVHIDGKYIYLFVPYSLYIYMTRTFRKDLERKFDHFPTSLYIVFLLNEKSSLKMAATTELS